VARFARDWSPDVGSPDLDGLQAPAILALEGGVELAALFPLSKSLRVETHVTRVAPQLPPCFLDLSPRRLELFHEGREGRVDLREIGRAPCRARVWMWVVA